MKTAAYLSSLLIAATLVPHTELLLAQTFPTKPVRIVTTEPGSGSDFVARLIAQGLTTSWGHQVIIDNRGGASGAIAAETVAKSPPDGYTLILYGNPLWLLPLFRKNVPYDPVRDFAPVSLAVSSPDVVAVHPSLPVRTIRELIALAKARPGELNYASSATGGSTHVAAELFKSMAGVNITRVTYRGVGAAVTGLIGGESQVMYAVTAALMPQVKAGKARALAVTSALPSPLAPGLPTVAESGVPGYESIVIFGVLAPAATSPALVNRISQDIAKALQRSDLKEKFFAGGMEVAASTPDHLSRMIKSEMSGMQKVISATGIRSEE